MPSSKAFTTTDTTKIKLVAHTFQTNGLPSMRYDGLKADWVFERCPNLAPYQVELLPEATRAFFSSLMCDQEKV